MSKRSIVLLVGLVSAGLMVWKTDADGAPAGIHASVALVPDTDEKRDEPPVDTDTVADDEAENKPVAEQPADEEKKPAPEEKKEAAKEEPKKEEAKKEPEKPKPHKVERKPLKIDAKIDGTFVAEQTQEIGLRPEVWSQFEVVEAVEHGATVKKGDVLVRFDDERIEEELADQSIDQRLGELALMQEEEEFPRMEKLLEMNFQAAKTAHEQLVADVEYYRTVDRPFMVRIAEYRYNSAKEDLASQREELAQLEKMYEADEVTEETEEIVLRRQKFEVATAELIFELQESSRDYTLNVLLPRNDEMYEKQLQESELRFAQAKTTREMGLTRGKYELEKKREARAKSVERHAKLVSDRALMVLRAPADGAVYYGRCINGKWPEIGNLTPKLQPFGTVTPNSVLMTIVKQRPLHIEASLTERQLREFKQSMTATITAAGDDELELSGKVTRIVPIPDASNKYLMELDVDLTGAPDWLVAGMGCQATITVYDNKTALVIPTDMVQTDEDDDKVKYVMVLDKEGKPVRRNVKLGRTKEKLVEVLSGLEEGDEIVKEEKKEDTEKQ